MLQVLQKVDSTFQNLPNIGDPFVSVAYRNSLNYRVDF